MELSEIASLIDIRNYIHSAINNYQLERNTITQLNEMLILIDRRIVEKLMTDEFKDYLGFQDAKKFMAEARAISDIKSGLKAK